MDISWDSVVSLGGDIVDAAVGLVGDAVEFVVDTVVETVETAIEVIDAAVDVAEQCVVNAIRAADAVCSAVVAGCTAIKLAWDNLDPGLKQWLVMGLSIAAAVALPGIGGVLVSCLIDGTFVDIFNSIRTGDWGMLALSLTAFIPGGKALKGLKFVDNIGGAGKGLIKRYGPLTKEMSGSGKQCHKLLKKRVAVGKYGAKVNDIEAISLHPKVHEAVTDALAKKIPRGSNYRSLSNAEIRDAYASVYGEGSDIMNAIEHYFL